MNAADRVVLATVIYGYRQLHRHRVTGLSPRWMLCRPTTSLGTLRCLFWRSSEYLGHFLISNSLIKRIASLVQALIKGNVASTWRWIVVISFFGSWKLGLHFFQHVFYRPTVREAIAQSSLKWTEIPEQRDWLRNTNFNCAICFSSQYFTLLLVLLLL